MYNFNLIKNTYFVVKLVKYIFFLSLFATLAIMCNFCILDCEKFHMRGLTENEFKIYIHTDCTNHRNTTDCSLFYGRRLRNLFIKLKFLPPK